MKILIAEDDAPSRAVLEKTIHRLGHECVVARDGLEAWNAFQNTPGVEVIVSDWIMPGIDGLELCRRVRGQSRDGYTFFVFLTALGSKQHLLQGMEAGADEYMTKPLDRGQLRVKLESASKVVAAHRHLNTAGGSEDRSSGVSGGPVAAPVGQRNGAVSPKRRVAPGKIWDILISQNKISEEQLQRALEEQKVAPAELGKLLVSLNYISEADLARAQAQRLHLDYVELDDSMLDPAVIGLVPEKMSRKHGALPIRFEDGRLVVAMLDPSNILAFEDLRMVSGYPVTPVVVTEDDFRRTQNKVYAAGEQVAEILEEAAGEATNEEAMDVEISGDPDEAPVIRLVGSILRKAISEGASDIHIEPHATDLAVRIRVDGVLRDTMSIPSKLQSSTIARLKVLANLDIAERRVPQDGRFSLKLSGQKIDLRVASLPTVYGESIVLRILDTSSVEAKLDKLGFSSRMMEEFERVFRRPYGTILVTGPTGSGKSTTLYATLSELNSPEKKIITVEDPVERRMGGVNQVQVNPKAGLTFASGLRSILRADPDIVMIGEIRDFETAKISVETALTGHLVLATLHTNDAPGALGRLTDMGVEPFLTASAIDCVIAQRLARRLCESCKEEVEIEEEILAGMGFPFELMDGEKPRFHKAVGCNRCGGSGYRGRVGIYEMMVMSDEIKDHTLKRASGGEISRAAEREGMVRLREEGLVKAARGMTTIEEVLRTVV